ncbi:MAG: fluoride efflux transporter CrcB [Eubacteriaceae bacterium]|nr:fluoride efflux transporter CrcB [Eubacteriaceae bacterium]
MIQCIFVGIGGFIGAVCRYLMGFLPLGADTAFPVKTLMINLIGAFLIGIIAAYALKTDTGNSNLVLMLKVGVCGGFTTFSTFAFEISDLIKAGQTGMAVAYGLGSIVAGVLLVIFAQWLVYSIIR